MLLPLITAYSRQRPTAMAQKLYVWDELSGRWHVWTPASSAVFPATSSFHSHPFAVRTRMLFGPVLVMDAEPLTACWVAVPPDGTTVSMLTPVVELAGTNVQPPAFGPPAQG